MNLQNSLRHPHLEIPRAMIRMQTRWLRRFYDGADVVSLAEGVWRAEARPSEAAEGTREREPSAQAVGG